MSPLQQMPLSDPCLLQEAALCALLIVYSGYRTERGKRWASDRMEQTGPNCAKKRACIKVSKRVVLTSGAMTEQTCRPRCMKRGRLAVLILVISFSPSP